MTDILQPLYQNADLTEDSLAIIECWKKFRAKKMTWKEMTMHGFLIALKHPEQLAYQPLPKAPDDIRRMRELEYKVRNLDTEGTSIRGLKDEIKVQRQELRQQISDFYELKQGTKNQNRANYRYLQDMRNLFKDKPVVVEKINGILGDYYENY